MVKTTGIDLDTFSELLYVRQGEIREILRSGRKGEFKLDTLLRLDAIERARQDVVREGGLRAVTSITEGGLRGGRLEVLERELRGGRREELAKLESEVSSAEKVLGEREGELRAVEEELNKLMSSEEELERLEGEYAELRQRLSMLSEEEGRVLSELDALRNTLNQLSQLRARVVELESVVSREGELRARIEELMRGGRDDVRARLALAQGYRQRAEEIRRELGGVSRVVLRS